MSLLSHMWSRRLPPVPAEVPTPVVVPWAPALLAAAQTGLPARAVAILDSVPLAPMERSRAQDLQNQLHPGLSWAAVHGDAAMVEAMLTHPLTQAVRAQVGLTGLLKLAEFAPGAVVRAIIHQLPPAHWPRVSLGEALADVAGPEPMAAAPFDGPHGRPIRPR